MVIISSTVRYSRKYDNIICLRTYISMTVFVGHISIIESTYYNVERYIVRVTDEDYRVS